MTTCKKCGGTCRPGKALYNPAFSDHPGEGATWATGTTANLVDVMKCENCGHSFTVGRKEVYKQKV